jgi:hypothetical protein
MGKIAASLPTSTDEGRRIFALCHLSRMFRVLRDRWRAALWIDQFSAASLATVHSVGPNLLPTALSEWAVNNVSHPV